MKQHPYLRAYLAGIAVPTLLLLVIMIFFISFRLVAHIPIPIERIIVFPMAVVPNLWGVWNMLYLRMHRGRWLPLGWHGAILPVLLMPTGLFLAQTQVTFEPLMVTSAYLIGWPFATAAYYLAWKFVVGYLNQELGIA
jgi:hypothetical protein